MVSRSSSRHFWLFVKIEDYLNLHYKKAKLNLKPDSWNSICDSFISFYDANRSQVVLRKVREKNLKDIILNTQTGEVSVY